jgi:hypothetical protein
MLEAHAPRIAFAQTAAPPKRVVFVMHSHGRLVGNGRPEGAGTAQDNWSPLAVTGKYPATGTLSPALAALGDIRNEIVTIDGVDNLVRLMTGDSTGHTPAELTCLTCRLPKADGTASGPSIDYVLGERLRVSSSQRSALVFPASPMGTDEDYKGTQFWSAGGTKPQVVNSNPAKTVADLFASKPTTPPPMPTLKDRLASKRKSILDAVTGGITSLRSQVSAADRDKLDQHAMFIQQVEAQLSGTFTAVSAKGCTTPVTTGIPSYTNAQVARGNLDDKITPFQIENLVMALACDVTRVASLHFEINDDPVFTSEFTGTSPFAGGANFHGLIHETPSLNDPQAGNLTKASQHYGKMFTTLVSRLAQVVDSDGSRLLDNTLVVWMSDLAYGASHGTGNLPVVLAGMKSAFPNGQGRHLVCKDRRSLGDLYAQVLRMVGGTDMTFGLTGKLGDTGVSKNALLEASVDGGQAAGYISTALNLHAGVLDL